MISPASTRDMAGKLIIFEGADGAGKSSVCDAYVAELHARRVPAKLLAFPGNESGTLGGLVYQIHHRPQNFGLRALTPLSLQTLHIAAHLDAIQSIIAPSLESGEWIVLDRYWWSTWVYGKVAGASVEMLNALVNVERLAWGAWAPSIAYHVTRDSPLRPEPMDHWNHLRQTYDELVAAEQRSTPIYVLRNNGELASTVTEALALLDRVLRTSA